MINIANLLRNAKKGTILWSPLFGPVEFIQLGKNDQIWVKVNESESFDKYGRYFGSYFTEAECLLFPSENCRTWEGWKAPVESNFKVGNWVVTDYGKVNQVVSVDKDGNGYTLDDGVYFSGSWCDMYHHWTIQDANDGDVLALNGKPFIYSHKYGKNYCYIDDCGQFRANFNLVLEGNCVCPATKQERDLLFSKMRKVGYEWDEKKKEIRKIIKPMFNVGDWITDGTCKVKITDINNTNYWYSKNCILGEIESIDKKYHLWTIQDAKNGDVLVNDAGCIFINAGFEKDDKVTLACYCYVSVQGIFYEEDYKTGSWLYVSHIHPATKEQCDLLFKKMKEAGYTWDADKKELNKINPHYGISNFHEGMPVLVREYDTCVWQWVLYSHFNGVGLFFAAGKTWRQCIPFEGNEALLGTTKNPSEEFINW